MVKRPPWACRRCRTVACEFERRAIPGAVPPAPTEAYVQFCPDCGWTGVTVRLDDRLPSEEWRSIGDPWPGSQHG